MKKKQIFIALCLVAVFSLMTGLLGAEAAVKLRFAGQNPIEHQNTISMNQIKELVEKETNGEIVVEVYPASQLGDYTLIYEELMRGSIDMALISVPTQFDPATQISIMPFVAKGYDEAKKVYAKGGWLFNKTVDIQAKQGIKFMGFHADGFGGLGLTKEPADVLNPAAKKGVLVRVPPIPLFKFTVEDMNYQTVSVPYAELYTALQTGIAEGWVGGAPSHNYLGFRDVIKHYYQLNIYLENEQYLMSESTWEQLSADQQKIIENIVAKVAEESFDISARDDDSYLEKLKEAGTAVYTYKAEQLEALAENAKKVTWPKFSELIGEELMKEMIEAFETK